MIRRIITKVVEKWKPFFARLVRWRPIQILMLLGIQIVVARHRVGVTLVPFDDQGRILLLNHVFHPFTPWGLPGGWLRRNESPAAAALRELSEETGLTANLGPVVHLEHGKPPTQINIAYLAYVTPQPMDLSAEIMEAEWFHPETLPKPMSRFQMEAIRRALGQWECAG